MTITRRDVLKATLGAAGLLALPKVEIAQADEPALRRFWPGWRAPRGGLDRFVTAAPGSASRPLTADALEAEMRALYARVASPQPWDLVYVPTDARGRHGRIGIWTGVAFVPLVETDTPPATPPGWTGPVAIVTMGQVPGWTGR